MSHATAKPAAERFELPSKRGEPAWELAEMFPPQGLWTEKEYLALATNRRIEFTDGVLEFYSMPTWMHEWILDFLHDRLKEFVRPRRLGYTAGAGGRVRLREGAVREPDVKFLLYHRISDPLQPSDGADIVFEVVSPDRKDRKRDLVDKRAEYAQAAIPEYWIVDPEAETITVLSLVGAEYDVHGEFKPGEKATSVLLPGFEIDVAACFAAGRGEFPSE